MHAEGKVTQGDANYFAYKVLRESYYLTQCIIKRFPIFVIDEAQDMTEVQHGIIDHLVAHGLNNVILIGDEQQAIYEWNTARPELFANKCVLPQWNNAVISGTFRSGPEICKTLNLLTKSAAISPAKGSHNEQYTDEVGIVSWNIRDADAAASFKLIIDEFARHLSSKQPHAGESVRLAILTRSKDDATTLRAFYFGSATMSGVQVEFEHTCSRDLLRAIYYLSTKDTYAAFKAYERMLFKLSDSVNLSSMRQEIEAFVAPLAPEPYAYRKIVYSDLSKLQKKIIKPGETRISDFTDVNKLGLEAISVETAEKISLDYAVASSNDQLVANLFVKQNEKPIDYHQEHKNLRLTFSTVHGVKGETHDGVLYVLKQKTLPCDCPDSTNLNVRIASHDTLKCESKRIQYVAMSRAAQTLRVAVASNEDEWEKLLNAKPLITRSQDVLKEITAEQWTTIWQTVRYVNQPLGGIIRMGTPRVEGDKLIVSFRFAFHAKRMNNADALELVRQVVERITGYDLVVGVVTE